MILESAWHYKCLLTNIVSIPVLMLLCLRYLGFISTYPDMWLSPITLQRRPSLSGCLTSGGIQPHVLPFMLTNSSDVEKRFSIEAFWLNYNKQTAFSQQSPRIQQLSLIKALKWLFLNEFPPCCQIMSFLTVLEERVWNKLRIVVCVLALDFRFITLAITVQRGCVRLWIHFVPY